MRFLCAPVAALPQQIPAGTKPIALYGDPGRAGVGSTGTGILDICRRFGLQPTTRAWDLLSVALSVIAADQGCSRSNSPDGWTRQLDVVIAVSEPSFWVDQATLIGHFLGFLTGDIWRIQFQGGGPLPTPPRRRRVLAENAVTLLSGGVDSLIGTIDRTCEGVRLVAVSQVASGDKTHQADFARTIGGGSQHLQLNHNARPPGETENSQRGRSFAFIAFGVLAATSLASHGAGQDIDLFLPENGFISLNIPLTPLRIGSLSTRTTHPHYIRGVQALLDAADLRVRLVNPYQFRTKGEMMRGCQDQALLRRFASSATSCGRYARHGFTHCGRCVPCLVRRAAFHAWGNPDATRYKYADLSIRDAEHRNFEDVRAVGMAIAQVQQQGLHAWIGGSLSTAQLGPIEPYVEIAQRGLDELAGFMATAGAL